MQWAQPANEKLDWSSRRRAPVCACKALQAQALASITPCRESGNYGQRSVEVIRGQGSKVAETGKEGRRLSRWFHDC